MSSCPHARSTARGPWPPTREWPRCCPRTRSTRPGFADAEVLHVSGYCLLREAQAEAALAAAAVASRVTLDLASAQDIEIFGVERFRALVEALSPELIFANEAERAALPHLQANWVIKLGSRGAIFPEGRFESLPATVADTTGAGDALAAGYLVGGPELAMRAAASCVQEVGALPN